MRSYKDQLKEISMQIAAGKPAEEVVSREVIAEDRIRVLVRNVGVYQDRNKKWWPTKNYELWTNKLMFKRDIPMAYKNGRQHLYMLNISGASEKEILGVFRSAKAFSGPLCH